MAESVVIDDIRYKLSTEDNTAAVEESWNPTFLEGDIVVPGEISYKGETYSVTEFSERAFYGCSEMTTISIPNTVKKMGEMCFRGCSKLTNITLPNSITYVGEDCFRNCKQLVLVNLPNDLAAIGQGFFTAAKISRRYNYPQISGLFPSIAFMGAPG